MNIQINLFSLATLFLLLFTSYAAEAQDNSSAEKSSESNSIEVIQFHSEHRCMTCNTIEELTRETLESYTQIPFSLVNVDEKENEKMADEFEAAGTALFLYNPKTGDKKELTDFAFMNAMNKQKFMSGLKKEIESFQK